MNTIDTAYTYSRFTKTDKVLFDNSETYGRWTSPITDAMMNTTNVYVVNAQYEGRPDLIANDLYGDPSLDWVLIAVNNATESLNWPSAGNVIKVPSKSLIASELV
jgi:hypothetical protein